MIDQHHDTILIVEDDRTNLSFMADALARSGCKIEMAANGIEAIARAKSGRLDLILLDIVMPGMDGFETCRRLKQSPATSDIPIILMTALDDTADKVKGLSLGAVDYITKPFQAEEVLARINVHLQMRSLTQELENRNSELERRVVERTAELTRALNDLRKFQLQLVQSEKMSALGQLVAGVAHEINNPIGFIEANLSHASLYVFDLLEHLQLYREALPAPPEKILDHGEAIDLDYLMEDLPKMIASMRVGTERIRNISLSLRTFSRADANEAVPFDLHQGIDSTLLILQHRLKANSDRPAIKVIKQYGNLPSVKCYPSQLNQVFMNLIGNGIDAIDCASAGMSYEELEKNPHWIKITTQLGADGDSAVISIEDNGVGMSGEIQQKIFDYLFTTKPLGKGTGIGLAISRHIVEEKHRGHLSCSSQPNCGASFRITIPL
ncbi:response regulator [Lyngbya sp. CCY1209]|uniref:sensor histidine kinase n=1 Tax=Lyngbya sp. CCY1209 TaxID=2886103 RepID=UPI002D1FC951|nr:response regulator [Lyngbya sp. CCY1209]MEB3883485.1 response regulator [Lyngbya sp. CCY1209]